MRRSVVLALLLTVALAGCGNGVTNTNADEGGGTETDASESSGERDGATQDYVDGMVAAMSDSDSEEFPTEDMECWMGRMADDIGVDRLEEVGFTPENIESDTDPDLVALDEQERTVVGESFKDCVDLEEVMLASMAASGDEIPPAVEECFGSIDWDTIEVAMADAIVSGNEDADMATGALAPLMGCMFMGLGEDMVTTTTVG